MLQHAKYQSPSLCSFRGEDFYRFSYDKTNKYQGWAINDQGVIIWTNLEEGQWVIVLYIPNIKPLGFVLSEKSILKGVPIITGRQKAGPFLIRLSKVQLGCELLRACFFKN